MPICIAGMGRSGTSMVTKLLHLCGLYLGDEEDLSPADVSNQDGFWENAKFVALNDAILNELGGAWDCPPIEAEWKERGARLTPLSATADSLLREITAHEPSGWKDPRNSLTLPFWQSFLPDLQVVVCVRNPLEVAISLARRQQFSYALSLNLWAIYNRRVLATVPPERRIVTHYDRYFADPEGEIKRVLRFVGMSASEDALGRCRESVAPTLRHQQFTTQHLRDAHAASDVMTLYEELCAEAGWVRERPTEPVPTRFTSTRQLPSWTSSDASRALDGESEGMRASAMSSVQPGVAGAEIGRLDQSAVTVVMLRQHVALLTAQIADCTTIIRELEGALEQCREAAAHHATSVQEQVTAQRQSDDRIRVLAEMLAQAEKEQHTRQEEMRAAQRQREIAEAEERRYTAWASELERRLSEIERSAWYRVWSRWHMPSH